MRAMKLPESPRVVGQEVITDQSDPRMIKFRKEHGEFEPGHPRKTVKLEITQYEAGPGEMKLETVMGYYESEPPPQYTAFFNRLIAEAIREVNEREKRERSA
ncbi:MAG: hypothetical protein PHV74_15435 [Dehalococcoidia bacterium]|nr:hypothetical protein [Dehalococcoidia bacterium]